MGKQATASKPHPKSRRSSKQTRRKKRSGHREYFKAFIVAIGFGLLIRTFVLQAFSIPSGSMEDTLLPGDFLLSNKLIYGAKIPFTPWRLPAFRDPKPGDVVIFQYPLDTERDFIKRVVAGPEQTIEIRNKILFVDRKRTIDPPHSKYSDPNILRRSNLNAKRDNYGPVIVPPNHFFMMGDNRDNSEDSRNWGFLPHNLIKGKATIVYMSWTPDPDSPEYTSLSSIHKILSHNLFRFHERVRWTRVGTLVQ